jgi:hypothetical protein
MSWIKLEGRDGSSTVSSGISVELSFVLLIIPRFRKRSIQQGVTASFTVIPQG